MVTQREITNYIKQAGKGCSFSFRKKLKSDLKNSLSDFLDENTDCTIEDILAHFGSPEKYADEYLLAMEETDRRNAFAKAKWFKRTVCIGMALVVIIIAVAAGWIVYVNSQSVGDYYTEEIHIDKIQIIE